MHVFIPFMRFWLRPKKPFCANLVLGSLNQVHARLLHDLNTFIADHVVSGYLKKDDGVFSPEEENVRCKSPRASVLPNANWPRFVQYQLNNIHI